MATGASDIPALYYTGEQVDCNDIYGLPYSCRAYI
jgi:hypothetical protein